VQPLIQYLLPDRSNKRVQCRRASASLGLLLVFALPTLGSTFDDYHKRVKQAVAALDTLTQSDETETTYEWENRISQTITSVRFLLPETETIEWGEEKFVAQNSWVHDLLNQYGEKHGNEALLVLRSLTERLQALDQRLTETKAAKESQALSGPQAASKLKEILGRQEFAKENQRGSAFERLLREFLRWLSKLFPQRHELSPGGANVATLIAQVLVFLAALSVIGYVFWKFAPRFFRRSWKTKKLKAEPRIVLGETLAPDQSAGDILAEAEALARQGDMRAAIRKAYIALLVELGERKVLSLAQHKTNRDYLRAVRKKEPLYSSMKSLTESFERHWYGFVIATENDWTAFRTTYQRTLVR
jgi:hypothetical protein